MTGSIIYFYKTTIMCCLRWISGDWYQHNFIIVFHFSDTLKQKESESLCNNHGVERRLCLLHSTGLINIFSLILFSTLFVYSRETFTDTKVYHVVTSMMFTLPMLMTHKRMTNFGEILICKCSMATVIEEN